MAATASVVEATSSFPTSKLGVGRGYKHNNYLYLGGPATTSGQPSTTLLINGILKTGRENRRPALPIGDQ